MTLYTSKVNIAGGLEFGPSFIPVTFSDELIDTNPITMIYSHSDWSRLSYLFAGYFEFNKIKKWFFSATVRTHDDLKEVVEAQFGESTTFIAGQLKISRSGLQIGEEIFPYCYIPKNLPRGAAPIQQFILSQYLDEDFYIGPSRH